MPRDKKPGLLYPLLVPKRPWQHITVDFKHCLKSKVGNNIITLFVDRLGKRPITILVYNTITTKQLAPLFLLYVVCYIGIPNIIVSDHSPSLSPTFETNFAAI